MKRFSFLMMLAALGLSAIPVVGMRAATCELTIEPGSLVVSTAIVMPGQRVKIYVTLNGACTDDIEGVVNFFEQGSAIGSKPFSIRAGGRPEEVWLYWTTRQEGNREIRVDAAGTTDDPPLSLSRSASINVMVDRDSDSDGVPDRLDVDRDNDGLTNDEEAKLRTDPLKMDTDQDGIDDKHDAFPLDPNRTKLPPPPPPLPPPPVVLPPVIPPPVVAVPKTVTPMAPVVNKTPASTIAVKKEASVPSPRRVVVPPVAAAVVVPPLEPIATTTEATATEVLVIPTAAPVAELKNQEIKKSIDQEIKKSSPAIPARTQALIATATASAGLAGFFLWKAKAVT